MSPRTIYLSRLIGLVLFVAAVSMLIDKPKAMETMRSVVADRSILLIIGLLGTTAGLALVLGHQVWSGGVLPIVVTVLGWVFLARGVLVLLLPQPMTAQLVDWFRFEQFFYVYLGVSAALGLYLTVHSFVASRRG